MSFFREYLTSRKGPVDAQFDERDESWFMYLLLWIRMGMARNILASYRIRSKTLPPPAFLPWASLDDPLEGITLGADSASALEFAATFACFFRVKPPAYRDEILAFKNYYIPGFASDREKHIRLAESALPSFSETPLQNASWESVADYFKIDFPRSPQAPPVPEASIPPPVKEPVFS